ncbi:citrate synthase [Jeotgalicoccus sp. ATCC 8456]|uniref:citrate synthase n=1 Tax=Jeotgalicoccus sp. ATCC 8456 TaxID=946435 RepID=UPI0018E62557|nr:citrate synthase [Jeotgalicoccus sp. ATCC 8456]QQD85254.1 citrate synthase [Jeotgalicoccus sp. ATCC 8456]
MTGNSGLEGVVIGESRISSIIGTQLTYCGYEIDDLAENAEFEEVVYLLWHDKLPNSEELSNFKKELFNHAHLTDDAKNFYKTFVDKSVHPMSALRTAVSLLSHTDERAEEQVEEATLLKAIRIQAKIPSIVAAIARTRQGLGVIDPNPDYGYAKNFLYMLNGEEPTEVQIEAMNKALILHADHEINASTFAARVIVATLSDMYSGVTGAIGALKGPLHGGANEKVMAMLEEIGSLDKVDDYIEEKLANKEKIMGIGHRVYKDGDPRAKYLEDMARRLTEENGEPELYEMSVKIAEIIERKKGLLPNVDFFSASVYHSLGIEHELFTPIFAVSRTSGWIAHIFEQYENNRLIRPRAEYNGYTDRKYEPIENR